MYFLHDNFARTAPPDSILYSDPSEQKTKPGTSADAPGFVFS